MEEEAEYYSDEGDQYYSDDFGGGEGVGDAVRSGPGGSGGSAEAKGGAPSRAATARPGSVPSAAPNMAARSATAPHLSAAAAELFGGPVGG